MNTVTEATNATKGIIGGAAQLLIQGIELFNIYSFTGEQKDWLISVTAFVTIAWIGLTKKLSKKRLPDS